MTPENVRKLHVLSRQLNEHLMSAALCAKEIGQIAQANGNDGTGGEPATNGNGRNGKHAVPRPLVDEATLSVIWRTKTLCLGNTKEFSLLAHLARRVNQYVPHVDLLDEIWADEFADGTLLRAAMQRLRAKLCRGGMTDLADSLLACKGRYILDLATAPRHREVTGKSQKSSTPGAYSLS